MPLVSWTPPPKTRRSLLAGAMTDRLAGALWNQVPLAKRGHAVVIRALTLSALDFVPTIPNVLTENAWNSFFKLAKNIVCQAPSWATKPLQFGHVDVDFSTSTLMGVLNVTPDSFSDGGKYQEIESALLLAQSFIDAGVSFIDVGGESSRPGAIPVPIEEEMARVIPIVGALSQRFGTEVVVSIDTRNRQTAEHAVRAGARLVNDISAFSYDPTMLDFLAESGIGIVLMHAKDNPQEMSWSTEREARQKYKYDDVVNEVYDYLQKRKEAAMRAGVKEEAIILDIGLGFGKTVEQNFRLIQEIDRFHDLGSPLLVGASRKSFLGKKSDHIPTDRLTPSLGVAFWCAERDVEILRVHDVEESASLLNLLSKIRNP